MYCPNCGGSNLTSLFSRKTALTNFHLPILFILECVLILYKEGKLSALHNRLVRV